MTKPGTKTRPTPAAAYWQRGRLVDGEPAPRSPWARILGVLAMLVVIDLFLARGGAPPVPATAQTHDELMATLAAAAADPGRPVLLIGDSVLAGDVMAPVVDDWEQQRVVDHMRAELGRTSTLGVHQIALDGLLPVDLEHIVAELDRVDPDGRVELVVELNLRYFSAAYAAQLECSREVLCELGSWVSTQAEGAVAAQWRAFAADVRRVDAQLHELAPVHRQRQRFGQTPRLDRLDGLAVARAPDQLGDADKASQAQVAGEGEGRVLEHYRSALIDPDHAQVAALERSLARVRARGRKALIFVTPLEDAFADRAAPEPELGGLHSELGALVQGLDDPDLRFVDLDHPLFVSALFLDHCHLLPDGNRVLALNLLHELSTPMRTRPPEAAMVVPEDFDQTLVARVDQGYAEGAAWQALFDDPDGIAVSRDGTFIVVADTHNHMLRQLRGRMRVVEPLAGIPLKAGSQDGAALRGARLDRPRHPTLLEVGVDGSPSDAVVFVDGRQRDRIRVVDGRVVRTPRFEGPSCAAYRRLRARDGWLYMLCDDGRVLSLGLDAEGQPTGPAHELLAQPAPRIRPEPGSPGGGPPAGDGTQPPAVPAPAEVAPRLGPGPAYRFEVAPGDVLIFSDPDQRLWTAPIASDHASLAGEPQLAFANTSEVLLPSELKLTFPFDFEQIGLANIADLRWVDRYGALLVADEHPLNPNKRDPTLERELSERVHLRLFDLDAELVYPWVKPIPHGEAYGMWNERSRSTVSYYHQGSFAVAQDDASMVWVERGRSRLFRLSDGLLGLIKFGNRNSKYARVELYDAIGNVAPDEALSAYAPHHYFDGRFDPFEREGPYLGLMVGSSLTTLVDRVGNYSLGRRFELELQRELGYRDNLRFDLFQRTAPSASLTSEIGMIDKMISSGVALDLILVEVNDHNDRFFRGSESPTEVFKQLSRLERLAAKTGAMVVLFDNTAMDANGRDGLRASTPRVHELLDAARKLGFLVVEPSDRMLRDLLTESPWGTQPWGVQEHHGAPYAIDRTAEVLSFLLYPAIREFLTGRTPARRLPMAKGGGRGQRLAEVFEGLELDRAGLPAVGPAYLQDNYDAGHLHLYVDLAGFRAEAGTDAGLDRVAAAVLVKSLDGEAYGVLADEVSVTLVEFDNYDEYGSGVLESAATRWERSFDADQLRAFLTEVGG